MTKLIGIISYLPDNEDIRKRRKEKIINLVNQCNKMFDLPILIIAQNWDANYFKDMSNVIVLRSNKLGIVGARKKLREQFLKTKYDYLIMLDDDLILHGDETAGETYLKEIDAHDDNSFGIFKQRSLLLFAISRKLFAEIDYPDLSPEKGEIFEDIYLSQALEKLHPEKQFVFSRHGGLGVTADAVNDPDSTWFHGQFDKHSIGDKTRELLARL